MRVPAWLPPSRPPAASAGASPLRPYSQAEALQRESGGGPRLCGVSQGLSILPSEAGKPPRGGESIQPRCLGCSHAGDMGAAGSRRRNPLARVLRRRSDFRGSGGEAAAAKLAPTDGAAAGVRFPTTGGAGAKSCGRSIACQGTSIAPRTKAQPPIAEARKRIGGVIRRPRRRGRCGRSCPIRFGRCATGAGNGPGLRLRPALPPHWPPRRGAPIAAPGANRKRGQ